MLCITRTFFHQCLILSGLILFFSYVPDSNAACALISDPPAPPAVQTYTVPISRFSPNTIGAQRLLTIGGVDAKAASARCSAKGYWVQKIENSSGVTNVLGVGLVHKTNLEGVGVRFQVFNDENILITPIESPGLSLEYSLSLLKVPAPEVTTGGMLDLSTLPYVSVYATESSSGAFDSSAVQITKLMLSGMISYDVPTCIAQDRDVWLGEYSTSDFTGNTVTSWADAGMIMTCDMPFSNAYNYVGPGGLITTRPEHFYSVSVSAVNGYLDFLNGIIKLDGYGATGLGVQLSRSQSEHVWSGPSWSDQHVSTFNSFKIPLYARFIQTESKVTPGPANSKITYTVEYK